MNFFFDCFHQRFNIFVFFNIKQDEHIFVVITVQGVAEEVRHDRGIVHLFEKDPIEAGFS